MTVVRTRIFHLPAVAIAALLLAGCARGQLASAPRSDGATVPLMVYGTARTADGSCAPLILFSPGLGGTERGYAYFGNGMAAAGYRVIVMGHKESGPEFLRHQIVAARSIREGIRNALTDRTAENGRLLDIEAALKFADATCVASKTILAGHSMGAVTAMLEAGARNNLGITPSPSAPRFNAFIALSPEGPGPVFTDHAWTYIRKPVLMMTGTRDQGSAGDYTWREQAYDGLPALGGAHWLGVIDNANHMDFARHAAGGAGSDVITASEAFLQGNGRGTPPVLPGVSWQQR